MQFPLYFVSVSVSNTILHILHVVYNTQNLFKTNGLCSRAKYTSAVDEIIPGAGTAQWLSTIIVFNRYWVQISGWC